MTTFVTTPTKPINISLTPPSKVNVGVGATSGVDVAIPTGPPGPQGLQGIQGEVGPMGPPGIPIVALPHDQWPPANPQPNTLYLRLAP